MAWEEHMGKTAMACAGLWPAVLSRTACSLQPDKWSITLSSLDSWA